MLYSELGQVELVCIVLQLDSFCLLLPFPGSNRVTLSVWPSPPPVVAEFHAGATAIHSCCRRWTKA